MYSNQFIPFTDITRELLSEVDTDRSSSNQAHDIFHQAPSVDPCFTVHSVEAIAHLVEILRDLWDAP